MNEDTPPEVPDELLLRYLDGTLSELDFERLNQKLSHDPALRWKLRDMAEQVFAIAEAARCREALQPPERSGVTPVMRSNRQSNSYARWGGILAAIAMLFAVAIYVQPPAKPMLLEVVAVRGAATWNGGGERVRLLAGMSLAAGTIEIENRSATADVRFADGTQLTISDGAEAAFSHREGKLVWLKRGALTAHVAPQPAGQPLRVRTTSAELEVLGTVFSIDATDLRTDLSVAEGRVRLKRLVDGREIQVAAKQCVAASLSASDQLSPEPMGLPTNVWQADFTQPPDRLTGTWQAAAGGQPAHVRAVPTVESRGPDGRVWVHHSVIVRAASNLAGDAFALVEEGSVLHLRLRLNKSVPLQLMLATRHANGSFSGNFELVRTYPDLSGDGTWQSLEVPIRELKPLHDDRPAQTATGNVVNVVIVTTLHESVGLDVAEISILPSHDSNFPLSSD